MAFFSLDPEEEEFFFAVRFGDISTVVRMLDEKPALVSATDFYNATPLFFVPDIATARVLLERGARKDWVDDAANDEMGDYPDESARDRGLDDVAEFIRSFRRPR